jgi:hypothetical protein
MLWALTPRLEVLAELTGLGPEPPDPPDDPVDELAVLDAFDALEALDGAVATQATAATSTATTTATVRIWVERERRTKWPQDRDTAARGFQRLPIVTCAGRWQPPT